MPKKEHRQRITDQSDLGMSSAKSAEQLPLNPEAIQAFPPISLVELFGGQLPERTDISEAVELHAEMAQGELFPYVVTLPDGSIEVMVFGQPLDGAKINATAYLAAPSRDLYGLDTKDVLEDWIKLYRTHMLDDGKWVPNEPLVKRLTKHRESVAWQVFEKERIALYSAIWMYDTRQSLPKRREFVPIMAWKISPAGERMWVISPDELSSFESVKALYLAEHDPDEDYAELADASVLHQQIFAQERKKIVPRPQKKFVPETKAEALARITKKNRRRLSFGMGAVWAAAFSPEVVASWPKRSSHSQETVRPFQVMGATQAIPFVLRKSQDLLKAQLLAMFEDHLGINPEGRPETLPELPPATPPKKIPVTPPFFDDSADVADEKNALSPINSSIFFQLGKAFDPDSKSEVKPLSEILDPFLLSMVALQKAIPVTEKKNPYKSFKNPGDFLSDFELLKLDFSNNDIQFPFFPSLAEVTINPAEVIAYQKFVELLEALAQLAADKEFVLELPSSSGTESKEKKEEICGAISQILSFLLLDNMIDFDTHLECQKICDNYLLSFSFE